MYVRSLLLLNKNIKIKMQKKKIFSLQLNKRAELCFISSCSYYPLSYSSLREVNTGERESHNFGRFRSKIRHNFSKFPSKHECR